MKMSNFITNSQTKKLKNRLNEVITHSVELKFLVGFFYFSGIRELYESLRKNPSVVMKILVGLNVENTIHGIIEYADLTTGLSDADKIDRLFNSLKKSLNTEQFDNKEFYEQARFFIEMIKQGRLIIRKTYEPNHAKLYIFKLQPSQIARNSLFITGSSNLTCSGLKSQDEFNVEISDYGIDEAEAYFDLLWQKAVPITENEVYKEALIKTLYEETLLRKITPFEAYVYVLKSYLDIYQKKDIKSSIIEILEKNGYRILKYQLDAISQALNILESHNGVILADVVGLGKTVIACAIAYALRKRGVIICPPTLMGELDKKNSGWLNYIEQFKLYDWRVFSSGKLEDCENFVKNADDIEVVIIDEAHRFRNEDTLSYEIIKNISRGRKIILLTATPFNNRPADVLSLLKLFVTPKKSTLTLEDNLADRFKSFKSTFDKLAYIIKNHKSQDEGKKRKLNAYYESLFGEPFEPSRGLNKVKQRSRYLANAIRSVIEPVTIRRNRLDLQNNPEYKDEITELSKVAEPMEWFYELTKEQSLFYDRVISLYFADPDDGGLFKGAIYRPFEYEKTRIVEEKLGLKENFELQSQRNLYQFMRRLLVKRFESSFGAFRQSLVNFKKITEKVLEFIEKTGKYILDRSLIEKIYKEDIDVIEQELINYSEKLKEGVYPKNHKIYELKKFKYAEKFINDIKSDLELFQNILEEMNSLKLTLYDPKGDCLIKNLRKQLKKEPDRKIIIFSEYADTVSYLDSLLADKFGERLLTVFGDIPAYKYNEIRENFDASSLQQQNRYDILLCTDKLSEGFNLNRAGMIINYDIPWNPVRVIQRVGRINRISKKLFDELYIVNFFPTEKGASLVKSREIASNKMFLIHNTLGEDSKIFDIDEEPTPSRLYEKIQQNPDELEEESFYTKVLKEFEKIKKTHPELINSLKDFPPRIKVAKPSDKDELFVVIKKGKLFVHYKDYSNGEIETKSLEEILERIKAEPETEKIPLSDRFWDEYEKIKNFREITHIPRTEHSLEQKAINNLRTILRLNNIDSLTPLKPFIRTLLEDIVDYGTLSEYTLRRIANISVENTEQIINELDSLKKQLGEDYLIKEKHRLKDLTKEIIIAIENRKLKA